MLQSLNLALCDQVTDEGLSSVAERCNMLQSLNIRSCNQVTDTGLARIAGGCSNATGIEN